MEAIADSPGDQFLITTKPTEPAAESPSKEDGRNEYQDPINEASVYDSVGEASKEGFDPDASDNVDSKSIPGD